MMVRRERLVATTSRRSIMLNWHSANSLSALFPFPGQVARFNSREPYRAGCEPNLG